MQLKQKKSGIYFVDWTGPDGERHRTSLKTRDPRQAKDQFNLFKIDAHPAQLDPMPKQGPRVSGMTFIDAMHRCHRTVWADAKSQATIRSHISVLGKRMGDILITDVTYEYLQGLVEEMRSDGQKAGTIKRKIDAIAKVLKEATMWSDPVTGKAVLASRPTIPQVIVRNTSDRIMEYAEEAAMLDAIQARLEAEPNRPWKRFEHLFVLLTDTGCRQGEALQSGDSWLVTASAAGQQAHLLALPRHATKNGKPRQVPLSQRIVDRLPEISAQAVNGLWFPMLPSMVWYMFNQIRTDIGAADLKVHTLRHTCATRLIRGGLDIFRLQKWLGHSDIKITAERYAHLAPSDLLQGLDILASNPSYMPKSIRESDISDNANNQDSGGISAKSGRVCH